MKKNLLFIFFITSLFSSLRGQTTYFISDHNGQTINTCSAFLLPSYIGCTFGGRNAYCDNENYTITFCSGIPGKKISIGFLPLYFTGFPTTYTIDIEDGYDFLQIYDGTSTSSPLLASLTGLNPNTFSYYSSGECLTIRFLSDNSFHYWGWAASIGCEPDSCNGNTYAADQCLNAPQICDLNGYCGVTSNWYIPDKYTLGADFVGGTFCGTIENNSWVKFKASATSATLNITSSNCTYSGSGIQAMIYSTSNCNTFTPVSSCYSQDTGPGSFSITTTTPLTIGQTYYLMIDGYAGNECDYIINPGSGVQVLSISGPPGGQICTGQNATLTITGANSGSTYVWQPISAISGSNTGSSITTNTTSTTTYTCTVTSSTGCNNESVSYTLTVNPLPTISLGANPSICQGVTTASLPYSATTNGPNQYSIDFNLAANSAGLADVVNASLPVSPISIAVPGAIATGTYNATLTVRNTTTGCTSSSYPISITVGNTNTPTFNAISPICSGDPAPTLPTTSTNGINGSWSPLPVSNTATNIYTFTPTVGQCANTTTLTVNVITQANAGTDGSTSVCDNSVAAINLFSLISGEQVGGTWTRTGGSGGTFNAGAGTFTPAAGASSSTFNYAVTGTSPCPNDVSTATVNISPQANAGTDGSTSVCDNSVAAINLFSLISGEQAGGTWTRTGGTGGTFNAGAGTFTPAAGATSSTFNYTISGTAPCPNDVSTATVTINSNILPIFNPAAYTICNGDPAPVLPITSTNGISGTWSPSPVSNTSSGTYTFTPTVGQCATNTTISVAVNNPIIPTFNIIPPICNGDLAPTLPTTSTNGISGTWSPSTVDNTANGTYTFTPNAGQCGTPTTVNVIVNPIPVISPVYHD